MIPENMQDKQRSFHIQHSSLIGLPSPSALRSNKFPGVWIGKDPVIGNNCVIYNNVFIGDKFRCGDDVFIRDNTSIGDAVTIGSTSFIDSDVVVGDNVTIGAGVSIPRTTRIGRDVTICPGVRFLAEPVTSAHHDKKAKGIGRDRSTILEDGCTVGKNAVISPGVCIGAGSVVNEGAVVTSDVPADAQWLKRC